MEVLTPPAPDLINDPDQMHSSAKAKDNQLKFVSFYLGETNFAIYAPAVAEVLPPLEVTPLPNSPENLRGIAPLRGEIVAMLDIKHLVAERTNCLAPRTKTLVLRSQGTDVTPIAFDVDKLGEIVSLPVDELRNVNDRSEEFLFGEAVANGGAFLVIDHSKLSLSIS